MEGEEILRGKQEVESRSKGTWALPLDLMVKSGPGAGVMAAWWAVQEVIKEDNKLRIVHSAQNGPLL